MSLPFHEPEFSPTSPLRRCNPFASGCRYSSGATASAACQLLQCSLGSMKLADGGLGFPELPFQDRYDIESLWHDSHCRASGHCPERRELLCLACHHNFSLAPPCQRRQVIAAEKVSPVEKCQLHRTIVVPRCGPREHPRTAHPRLGESRFARCGLQSVPDACECDLAI